MDKERPTKSQADYESECDNCGQTPVVDIVDAGTGTVVHATGLCGACCFGEADCIDPENW